MISLNLLENRGCTRGFLLGYFCLPSFCQCPTPTAPAWCPDLATVLQVLGALEKRFWRPGATRSREIAPDTKVHPPPPQPANQTISDGAGWFSVMPHHPPTRTTTQLLVFAGF